MQKKHQRCSIYIQVMFCLQRDQISIKKIFLFSICLLPLQEAMLPTIYQIPHTEELHLKHNRSSTSYLLIISDKRSSPPYTLPSVRASPSLSHSKYTSWILEKLLVVLSRQHKTILHARILLYHILSLHLCCSCL